MRYERTGGEKETMKAFIGIYQEKEQANRYLDSLGMEPEAVMEVGPFVSQFQTS